MLRQVLFGSFFRALSSLVALGCAGAAQRCPKGDRSRSRPKARKILNKKRALGRRSEEEEKKVLCDLNSLDQILLNLLTNALDAVAGESQPCIRLGSQISEEGMEIFVEDNGSGVSEENLARIFDPFFTTKEVGQGTGLGLSIVHTLVDRHGGYLRVEPAPKQGVVFTVVLPLVEKA